MAAALGLPLASAAGAPGTPEALRELSTDRPDTTESPRTVDAGHFQFEMELAAWEKDGRSGTLHLGELNLKAGLTPSTDLQLVLPLYSRAEGGVEEGFGDMELRLKYNLRGNEGGPTALALLPWLKAPTARDGLGNDRWEGGVALPFAFEAGGGWEAAVMTGFDLLADGDGSGYHAGFVNSITAGRDLSRTVACFLELACAAQAGEGRAGGTEVYFNTGLVWSPSPRWQVDGGLRTGLTRHSTDLTPFLGLSAKF